MIAASATHATRATSRRSSASLFVLGLRVKLGLQHIQTGHVSGSSNKYAINGCSYVDTDADPLTANRIRQLKKAINGCETIRVEVRGKKMLGLPLWKLPQQTNRFERFRFADLSGAGSELPPHIKAGFLAMCRQDGVKAALAAYKHTEHARSVPKFWRSHQATWWKPEQLWEQACAALRESRIFPDSAFEPPPKRT